MNNKVKKKNAIVTATGKSAYLFGNGINRLGPNTPFPDRYEWSNLLHDLNRVYASSQIQNINEKPFPMVYDEIVNFSLHNNGPLENDIKRYIQTNIQELGANNRYLELPQLNANQILTTNYDYLIEQNLEQNWQRAPVTRLETNYSIYRNQLANQKKIWHIHGEQADIRSIMLGFRHYINSSSRVKARAELFVYDLKSNIPPRYPSWVDLFFTHNVFIVGLGMKFTEYPLWWLLAYRHYKSMSDNNIHINNTITLVMPSFSIPENNDLIDMLRAYGVLLKPVDVPPNDYDEFYSRILNNNINI